MKKWDMLKIAESQAHLYMEEGWEPFAVVQSGPREVPMVYLKKTEEVIDDHVKTESR